MTTGFTLRELTVTGPDKPDATVRFSDGLNVISGPSDTGKSYILQCIDYALGAGKPPKRIKAAAGYTTVRLVIEGRSDGHLSTLTRSLKGGGAKLERVGEADQELRAKHHDGDTGTISGYLLNLCGLLGTRVRMDQSGTTRGLSFRDLAPLVLINDGAVTTEESPVRGRRQDTETVELRVFRLLLTGEDDSSVVAHVKPGHLRQRRTGQVELLERLLEDLRSDRSADSPVIDDLAAGELRLRELEAEATQASSALVDEQRTAAAFEERRKPVWKQLRESESRLQVLHELQSRFELLREQYGSDLRRLGAITEASGRLEQLAEGRCTVCGALAVHHDPHPVAGHATSAEVAAASAAEAAKIVDLLTDLEQTLAANATDIASLSKRRDAEAATLHDIDEEIQKQMRPRLAAAARLSRETDKRRGAYAREAGARPARAAPAQSAHGRPRTHPEGAAATGVCADRSNKR